MNAFLKKDTDLPKKLRYPTHTFALRMRPFVIQPFMIAPVLPGETLTKLSMQARVVADPVVDKMTGCHAEFYYYYVKLRDLDGRDDFEQMLIDPSKDISAYYDTTDDMEYYFEVNGSTDAIPWSKLCYQRIVKEWFRGENEAWNDYVDTGVSGLAVASINNVTGWLSSVLASDDVTAADETISTAGDNAFTISEFETAMRNYQLAQTQGLVQQSFEDYLRNSGVATPETQDLHRPELLFMQREWTYPTNAVEPTDGSVASSWVWSPQMIRQKDRKYFTEPGFIMGVTIIRPKTYLANLTASPSYFMNDITGWLPPELRNQSNSGIGSFAAGTGPAGAGFDTEAYQMHFDDLLLYGDQWTNFTIDGDTSSVALPIDGTDLLNIRYPTAADINALFVDSTNTNGLRFVRQDGIVNMAISSYLQDSVPGMPISD